MHTRPLLLIYGPAYSCWSGATASPSPSLGSGFITGLCCYHCTVICASESASASAVVVLTFHTQTLYYTNSAIQCQTVAATFFPLTWDNAASVSILLTGAPLPPVQSPVPLDLRMKFRIPGAASALPVGALIAL